MTYWLTVGTLLVLAYAVYEVLVWPMIDMTEHPKLRRPWTIRRWLNS